jgi:hypothetical protein
MKKALTIFSLLAVSAGLTLAAETWQRRIVDVTCYDQAKSATTCDPTGASTTFALVVSNQAFKLDAASNSKVAEALKSRADRAKDPAKPATTEVMAKATGTKNSDDTLKLDTIDIQ